MAKDTSNSQDLLNEAIREASGTQGRSAKAPPSRPADGATGADLRSVLNELTGTVGGAKPIRADTADSTAPSSLGDILQGQWQGKVPSESGSRVASPHMSAGTGINELIRDVSAGHYGAPVTNNSAGVNTVPLGQAAQDSYVKPQAAVDKAGAASGISPRNLTIIAVAMILLVVGAAMGWWANHQPSGPAGTLHELAKAAEHYRRSHNGQLPKELATLEAFPKDAVEWPLRYWNARDAAGRTEIIWVPMHSGHYRIVLRQGSEAWTVSDTKSTPQLILKGQS
jgi:hypothetical protein